MFTINEILDIAIQIEKNGESVYRKAMEKASDPAVLSVLGWIADEEVAHRKWFAALKQKTPASRKPCREDEMEFSGIRELLGNQTFSLEDKDISRIQHISELLAVSIEFENDTVLFYQLLRSFLREDDTRLQLDGIIDEENNHIEKLKTLLPVREN